MSSKQRIGIFAGTFDPVHTGHITFALQALEQGKLDQVVFVPERRPRHKQSAEHFGHRVAMVRQAIKPHAKLSVLELVEAQLSTHRSLPHLRKVFPDAELALLVGSDVLPTMSRWPGINRLMSQTELVVGVREGESPEAMQLHVATWDTRPRSLHVFDSFAPAASSSKVRGHLQTGRQAHGVLASVRRYSVKNWLYVRLPK
jgi:nicotinate-nucleotide adenylyltransferase